MKKLVPLVFAVLLPLLMLSACGGTSSINVGCDDFMQQKDISKQIEIGPGYTLSVYLCSNPTTGFQWSESAVISDQSVMQQTAHEFVAPKDSGGPPLTGAPGTEEWTFKANKKGTSTIKMEYSRPWEGGEKSEWTFTLTVTVK
jgi:inhibitor of cysteine peptidase